MVSTRRAVNLASVDRVERGRRWPARRRARWRTRWLWLL